MKLTMGFFFLSDDYGTVEQYISYSHNMVGKLAFFIGNLQVRKTEKDDMSKLSLAVG